MDRFGTTMILFLLAACSAPFLTCSEAVMQFSCSQVEDVSRINCEVNNWSNARNLTQGGVFANLTLPTNQFTVQVRFRCSGQFTQNVLFVPSHGFYSCIGAFDENGRYYVLKSSHLLVNEATIHACYRHVSSSFIWHLQYAGSLEDHHFAIGTVADSTTFNPQAVDSLIGGQCSKGLKLHIQLNWQHPPTTMSTMRTTNTPDRTKTTNMSNTTKPTNSSVTPITSRAIQAIPRLYFIYTALCMVMVCLV
eukprot:scpid95504/ scgid21832/ 